MNREILYRGINFQKEWVYGDLFHSYANDDIAVAYYREGSKTPTFDAIFPESFGQYTGLTDKNGVKIFEGDILEFTVFDCFGNDTQHKGVVKWTDIGYIIEDTNGEIFELGWVFEQDEEIIVIGNITDNPELIK